MNDLHGRADSQSPLLSFADVWSRELHELAVGLPPRNRADEAATETEKLRQVARAVDSLNEPLAALCLSGGGIRSASFALGALQTLAGRGLLGKFHYLSTVSGGGYIGGWLSAWRLAANNDQTVIEGLLSLQSSGNESPEIQGIRADSNYLTPKLGLMSADTWTVLALYVRNLFLNWCIFVPFFLGAIMIPRVCLQVLTLAVSAVPEDRGQYASLLVAGAAIFLTIALAANVYSRHATIGRRLSRRQYLTGILLPTVVAAMMVTCAACFTDVYPSARETFEWGVLLGASVYSVSWWAAYLALKRQKVSMGWKDLAPWAVAGALVGLLGALAVRLVINSDVSTEQMTMSGLSVLILVLFVGELIYVGLSSFLIHAEEDREWLARSSGWLFAAAITWLVWSCISLYGPVALRLVSLSIKTALAAISAAGISGAVALILGWSRKTAAAAGAAGYHPSLSQIAGIAAIVFALSIGLLLSAAAEQIEHAALQLQWQYPGLMAYWDIAMSLFLIVLAALVSTVINVNRFSLHALYRNRIIRTFLGSARANAKPPRAPDAFTGFDFSDNRRMADLNSGITSRRLLHVINTALNVVSSPNLAWQERKAESFTITPVACGNSRVGFRFTRYFGDRNRGICLGTAMAISGAAVSPNQGYNSSPLLGFLLMLFNLRLGWWLGNPRRRFYQREGPVFSLTPALKEIAGATTDTGNWIYLSDGGHFENLGVYEMVRRRCRLIVVSDAGCDPECTFNDLGNAARKCFIDFGVGIEFSELKIVARRNPPTASARVALGVITYPGSATQGVMLYVKPTYCATTEPPQVRSYAATHPEFPHESTADQWFSESQMEAYRALGAHIFERVCNGGADQPAGIQPPPLTFQALLEAAKKCLAAAVPDQAASPAIGN
jgi:hypothetical protein